MLEVDMLDSTRGIYSMLQVYLIETYLISTIYHQPLLYVVHQ